MKKTVENDTLETNLNNKPMKHKQRVLPPFVVSRAKSAGTVGEIWLANLDNMISELEKMWNISVGETLTGGTHAFVACANGQNREKYVLKIDMPENFGGEFPNSMTVLEMVDGHGYAKLYAYDLERKACLLERLGKPVNQLGYTVYEQLWIICSALQKAWKIPVTTTGNKFPSGTESIAWFREFIGETWEKLNHPCSYRVIKQAFHCLQAREDSMNPEEFVLLHGDAHGGNTLKDLSGKGFKLIDPDGIIYEKAYDLGVLMREWIDEYKQDPLKKGRERCAYLHRLTGVSEKAIWEWGYLQTISTAFVLLQIGQEETGCKMLEVAEHWACENSKTITKPDYMSELTEFLTSEYGFQIIGISPAKRGFYGETWNVQTKDGEYFIKIDDWQHHKIHFQNSLCIVQYMTNNGISFIPKVIKTKDDQLYSNFKKSVLAVFEHVEGELFEDCSASQLYRHLAKIYQLKINRIELKKENFDVDILNIFQSLLNTFDLPSEVIKALARKKTAISRYAGRLKQFSAVCKGNDDDFHITHGDAGGNCILNDKQLFIVDWDSVMLAPIERDAWIFIYDRQQLDKINVILAENGIDYMLEQNRLCYYCYYFFFYYLNEYLKAMVNAKNEEQRAMIIKSLIEYLTDSWIYKRLDKE